MADAAQEFLDKQLSKNRFTAKQQARLDASGGPSVAGSGDGVVPEGNAYSKYGKMPKGDTKSASDYMNVGSGGVRTADFQDSNNNNTDDRDETTSDKPTTTPSVGGGTKPSTSSNGIKSSRTADEIRKEFGLIYDPNNTVAFDPSKTNKGRMQSDDGHMWYKDSAGQTQYLGQVAGGYERGSIGDDKDSSEAKRKGSDKSKFHGGMKGDHHQSSNAILQQAHDDRNGPGHDNGFNSINDLAEAFRHMLTTEAPKAAEKERTPIEHSPEIKQATERVRAYEDNVMSGKTSEDIFGSYDTDLNLATATEQSTNNGDAGVGTGASGSPAEAPAKAANSFLDAKKTNTKLNYNFKPASGKITYGDN